jgi:hypothetical protein
MSFCPGTPKLRVLKFSKLRLLALWKAIASCVDLWFRWGLKQSYSLPWDLFKDMWHATWTQINQGDSWFLVVGSQIGNLTPDPFFGHNLCFKYSNGSWNPILDIYVSRAFQEYKGIFNPMIFDPWNCSLKIWESIATLTLKVSAHLGVCGFIPSHSLTLLWAWNVILELHFWPAPLQTLALVTSPRLKLWHWGCYIKMGHLICQW